MREITLHTMLHENIKKLMEGFQYDAHPMGIVPLHVGALSTIYPDAKRIHDEESRRLQIRRLIAKVPTHRRLRVPPQHRPAVRLSGQRPELHRQLPEHAVQDDGAQVPAASGARARARRPVHPARRPRAELQHERDARHRQLAGRSVLGAGRRGGGALRPAARRRERGRAADAQGNRLGQERPRLHHAREARRRPADGLRPPRLQVLRPARADHQADRRRGLRRHGHATRCSTSRSSSSGSRSKTTTSSRGSSTRTSISTPASSTRRWASRVDMFPVLFAIPRTAGWLAQWDEMLRDADQKIARPRQIYTGAPAARLRPARESKMTMTPGVVLPESDRTTPGVMSRLFRRHFFCCSPRPPSGCRSGTTPGPTKRRPRQLSQRPGRHPPFDSSQRVGAPAPDGRDRPAAGRIAPPSDRPAPTSRGSSRAIGLTVEEQPFTAQTPSGPVEMVNLIVTLAGRRPDRMLITGHYDTKLMPNQRFVGASDGASSAAMLIELARVLKDRPREFTYELVWFDGEEAVRRLGSGLDHTYGSRYYVQAATKAKAIASIKAMILLDMVGDKDLQIRRDRNSTGWLNDLDLGRGQAHRPRQAVRRVRHRRSKTTTCRSSRRACRRSTSSICDYPTWHTPDDDLDHVSAASLQIVGDVAARRAAGHREARHSIRARMRPTVVGSLLASDALALLQQFDDVVLGEHGRRRPWLWRRSDRRARRSPRARGAPASRRRSSGRTSGRSRFPARARRGSRARPNTPHRPARCRAS